MALLDTFTLLFETNATEASDEVDSLNNSLDETESSGNSAAQAINETSQASSNASTSFDTLATTVKAAIAAYLSFSAVKSAIFDRAVATDVVGKFSDTLGLSVEKVDDWSEAVIRSGGSADSFRGSVDSLNRSMGDIALGAGNEIQEVFGRLGISALDARGKIKDVFNILPELADAFQRLSAQESVAFGRKLGLDQGTILLLQQGRDNVDALVERQRQLGGITKEGAEASATFNDAWADSQRVFIGWADSVNQKILPVLTSILTGFQEFGIWINENQDLVQGFFIGVTGVILTMYLPAIASAAAATLVAMLPFIKIAAVIALVGTAFALIFEDIKAFVNGQESLLGNLIKKYEWLRDAIDFVSRGFDLLAREFGIARDTLSKGIGHVVNTFKNAQVELADFFEAFAKMFSDIRLSATDAIEWIVNLFNKVIAKFTEFKDKALGIVTAVSDKFKGLKDALSFDVDITGSVSGAFDKLGSFVFGEDEDETEKNITQKETEKAINQVAVALQVQKEVNSNPILVAPSGIGQSRVNYIQQNNTFKSDINASGMSSQEAKQVFTSNLREEMSRAKSQIDDGVDR